MSGSIEQANDHDWFRILLDAGTSYTFRMIGSSLPDTYLFLRDATGAEITHNDDASGTLNSEIVYQAASSGTYYLDASGFSTNIGTYTLSATSGTPLLFTEVQDVVTLPQAGGTWFALGGDDWVTGTVSRDVIFGDAGDDTLIGEGGNDDLYGGTENDALVGGLGSDFLDGGLGNDFALYFFAPSAVVVDLATNTATGGDGSDTLINIEGVGGSEFGDILRGNGGNNNLLGEGDADTLDGRAGNDVLDGGLGLDRFIGGLGNDVFYVDSQAEIITEILSQGTDTVVAGISYSLAAKANVENLSLTGSTAISGTGNTLNNVLDGSKNTAANTLSGLTGHDVYIVGAGDRIVEIATGGTDTVRSSLISINLASYFNVENVGLTGALALNATGNGLANAVTGNAGANILNGAGGNDFLNGAAGSDRLTGGAGLDYFTFNTALSATANVDRITDLSVVSDTIRLENAIFTKFVTAGVLNAAFFRVGAAAADANDYIVYNKSTGALSYDSNGSGAGGAVQFAALSANLSLTSADFLII